MRSGGGREGFHHNQTPSGLTRMSQPLNNLHYGFNLMYYHNSNRGVGYGVY